jgi:hypothetical protein
VSGAVVYNLGGFSSGGMEVMRVSAWGSYSLSSPHSWRITLMDSKKAVLS